ncbi:hypothetical protein AA0120_g6930 [Alternaria tenuissima]|nr:hypothetical protein AA0120_g6930 [Alternaria tenuissima]RYO61148.1 hypothetical protein AA0116_g5508 [Alternaria tenuissima]
MAKRLWAVVSASACLQCRLTNEYNPGVAENFQCMTCITSGFDPERLRLAPA